MTEAMKSMDSGMAAAEMELRAARRAVPAAEPHEASATQQPSATLGSKTKLAGTAALEGSVNSAVQESQDSAAPAHKLDSLQSSVQRQTPKSQTGQEGDHPPPAASGFHDMAEQRNSDEACMDDTTAAAMGGLAGSDAEPVAGGVPHHSSGPAALSAVIPTAQQSQQPAQVHAAPKIDIQPHDMKSSKQVTGVQLHIHADSSAGQAAFTQPVSASSSASRPAASCLPAVEGYIGAAESSAHGVSQTPTMHTNVPTTDGSMPVHSCQVHPFVDTMPEAPKVPVEAVPCPAGPVSSAESAHGNSGSASVSAARQAGSAASAVTSIDCSEASHQPGAAVEPWAADEGDFADMIKEFLVRLKATPMFVADVVRNAVAIVVLLSCSR